MSSTFKIHRESIVEEKEKILSLLENTFPNAVHIKSVGTLEKHENVSNWFQKVIKHFNNFINFQLPEGILL